MSSLERVGGVAIIASGRNRARRRATIAFEPMEPRLLMAAIPNATLAATTVCVPALPATAKAVGETTFPDRGINGQGLLSPTDRAWLEARRLEGQGQIVAIVDSGIAYRHEALGAGLGPQARVVGGFDFAEGDADPDDDGPAGYHGTHVAGIVGGQDGNRSGLAPGVAFVALRVFDDRGQARPEWIEAALRWVSEHRTAFAWPITTVNLSLGALGSNAEQTLRSLLEDDLRRLRDEGVFVAVAAGNRFPAAGAANASGAVGEGGAVGVGYPASSAWVTPVAAVDGSGGLAGFSERLDGILAAPGEGIVSTVPDYLTGVDGRNDDYWATTGTSMAAPQVAAVSVLARQAWRRAGLGEPTVAQLEMALRAGADERLDAATGVEYAVINPRATIEWIEARAGRTTAETAPANDVTASGVTASGVTASGVTASGVTAGDSAGLPAVSRASEADAPLFCVPRVRIPQFPTSHGANGANGSVMGNMIARTVIVGDGQSAVVRTLPVGLSAAVGEREIASLPESGAAEARMRAIDLVLSMLDR
jgi:hypothetical protein